MHRALRSLQLALAVVQVLLDELARWRGTPLSEVSLGGRRRVLIASAGGD